jgi:hypothetical protein
MSGARGDRYDAAVGALALRVPGAVQGACAATAMIPPPVPRSHGATVPAGEGDTAPDPATPPGRRLSPGALAWPVVLGAVVLVCALRGGTYDTIARGEAFVVVWWALALGVGFGFVPAYRATPPMRVAIVALALLAGWTVLAFTWTESDGRTMAELCRTLGFLGFLLFVVWATGGRTRVTAMGVLAGVALLVSAMALLSRLWPSLLPSALSDSGYEVRRLSYPFNYWNALGAWAAMSVALGLAWAAHARLWWLRGAALAGACIAASAGYLTYSRTAAIAMALAPLAVLAFAPRRRRALLATGLWLIGSGALVLVVRDQHAIAEGQGTRGAGVVVLAVVAVAVASLAAMALTRRAGGLLDAPLVPPRHRRAAGIAGAGAVVAVVVVVLASGLAGRAWDSFQGGEARSATDPAARLTSLGGERHLIYAAAMRAFRAHPLDGTGPGTFEFTWAQDPQRTEQAVDAHSLYLEALSEMGLPGGILVAVLVLGLVAAAARRAFGATDARAGGAAAGGAAAVLVWAVAAGVDWMWESTAVTLAALAAAGVAAAGPGVARRAELRGPARIAIAVAALLVVAVQLPEIMGTNALRTSQRSAAQGDEIAALSSASDAVRLQGYAGVGYLQRALVLEQLGDISGAVLDAKQAVRREPENWRGYIVLARIEARRGDLRAALAATRRARELNPRSPLFSSARGAQVTSGLDAGNLPSSRPER